MCVCVCILLDILSFLTLVANINYMLTCKHLHAYNEYTHTYTYKYVCMYMCYTCYIVIFHFSRKQLLSCRFQYEARREQFQVCSGFVRFCLWMDLPSTWILCCICIQWWINWVWPFQFLSKHTHNVHWMGYLHILLWKLDNLHELMSGISLGYCKVRP